MIRLSIAVLLSSAAFTAFMAALAWEALRLSGRAGGPGVALAVAAGASLCAGPLLGVWVDRLGGRRALIASQLGVAAVLSLATLARYGGFGESMLGLLLLAAAHGVVGALTNPAMHVVLQGYSTPETATTLASRNGIAVALGFVLGYGGGGTLLDYAGFVGTLATCVGVCLVVVWVANGLNSPAAAPAASPGGESQLLSGLRYVWSRPRLREAALGFALCYTVFHTATALLPPFSKLVLLGTAKQFGFLRAAWSVGSACGALGLSLWWGRRRASDSAKFVAIAVLGLIFAVFGVARDFPVALTLISLVGFTHSACRALLDGYLLQLCERSVIGRVRGVFNGLVSGVSLLVFAAASAVQAAWITSIFIGLGITVSALSALIYARHQLRPLATDGEGAA